MLRQGPGKGFPQGPHRLGNDRFHVTFRLAVNELGRQGPGQTFQSLSDSFDASPEKLLHLMALDQFPNLLFGYNITATRMRALLLPLLTLIAGAGTLLSLLFGGRLVILGALTVGELVALTTYDSQFSYRFAAWAL